MLTAPSRPDWLHRLPAIERHEEIMAGVSDSDIEVVEEVTDNLLRQADWTFAREDFGYPRTMTTADVLNYSEHVVMQMLERGRIRELDVARLSVIYGYSYGPFGDTVCRGLQPCPRCWLTWERASELKAQGGVCHDCEADDMPEKP